MRNIAKRKNKMKVTTAVLLVLVAHLAVVKAYYYYSGDYYYYSGDHYYYNEEYYEALYRSYRCFPDEDLSICIFSLYSIIPGTSAAQDTFCDDCRIKLQAYATVCLHEALAKIYNSTIATVCEKQSDFDCIPNTEQQACLLRYGVAPSLLAGDDGNFCDECRDDLVEYTSTCVGETAADELGTTLQIACDAGASGATTAGVALVALIQALLLAFLHQ